MEANDTILNRIQRAEVFKYLPYLDPSFEDDYTKEVDLLLLAQAELTWAAREPEIAEARRAGYNQALKDIRDKRKVRRGAQMEQITRIINDETIFGHLHPNGGGFVADTAFVALTAFIGSYARVYGEARVEGEARVYGEAQVYGEARNQSNVERGYD